MVKNDQARKYDRCYDEQADIFRFHFHNQGTYQIDVIFDIKVGTGGSEMSFFLTEPYLFTSSFIV